MVFSLYGANMIRTQIQFTKESYQKLKDRSRETGKSISELVRRSLDQSMAAQDLDTRWQRALGSMGKFDSGLKDLSEKHDSYLADRW